MTDSPIIALFNRLAPGYDCPPLRLYPFCADAIINGLGDLRGKKILDIASGTAHVAIAAAQAVGNQGRVFATDLAAAMLDQGYTKMDKLHYQNIDWHEMDAARLDFRRDYFDYALCSHALHLLPDPAQALREWARVVRPGGTVLFSVLTENALQPGLADFYRRLGEPRDAIREHAEALARPEYSESLLREAGLVKVRSHRLSLGYYLAQLDDWWEVLTQTEFRRLLRAVRGSEREALREAHLAWMQQQVDENGLRLNAETLIVLGEKPDAA